MAVVRAGGLLRTTRVRVVVRRPLRRRRVYVLCRRGVVVLVLCSHGRLGVRGLRLSVLWARVGLWGQLGSSRYPSRWGVLQRALRVLRRPLESILVPLLGPWLVAGGLGNGG